jgi:hypothetical protein
MTTHTHTTDAANTTAAQKIESATINDARRWSETQDKAAFIADFLGLLSINQLLNNPDLEDQTEQRFAALRGNKASHQSRNVLHHRRRKRRCRHRRDGHMERWRVWRNDLAEHGCV